MVVVDPQEQIWFDEVRVVLNQHIQKLQDLSHERTHSMQRHVREVAEELPRDGSDVLGAAQELQWLREAAAGADEAGRRLRRLLLQAERPYFGRFDFRSAKDPAPESYYLGIGGVTVDGQPLIYDWRTPVASLYYDAEPGLAEYQAPVGTVAGELSKKRQYVIRQGHLVGAFDTTMPIGDEVLTAHMAAGPDPRMTSIVATIQREQNRIIRAPRGNLAVQGPAGSGKTSVALQRIAYQLYRYRTSLSAQEILFVSPNLLFRDYISGVLPELGEENPASSTWGDIVRRVFSDGRVESWVDAAERALEPGEVAASTAGTRDTDERRLAWKASSAFLEHLEQHAARLTGGGIPFRSLHLDTMVVAQPELFARWFYRDFAGYPVSQRWDDVAERLQSHIKRAERQLREHLWVQFEAIAPDGATLKRRVERGVESLMGKLREVVGRAGYVDFVEAYRALYRGPAPRGMSADEWRQIARQSLSQLASGVIPYEDSGGLLWLRLRLGPGVPVSPVQEIFVDEAQDYTPCHLAALGRLFREARVTLVGDPFQSLYRGYGLKDFGAGLQAFRARGGAQVGVHTLSTSYRSSPAIMRLAEAFLPETRGTLEVASLGRNDRAPRMVQTSRDDGEWTRVVSDLIQQARDRGHERVVVLGRTRREARQMGALLESAGAVVVNDAETRLPSGVLVMSILLAKGLEFDTVILGNAQCWPTAQLSDRKLLYTAATRAIHEFWMVCRGPLPAGWPKV